MKPKEKPIQEIPRGQSQPWERYKFIPLADRRATWEEACRRKQVMDAREREASLEALYQELLATGDFYRWRVLEKLSDVRSELIRIGGLSMPWETA